mgnify:CR=1 FL=1
MSVNFEFKENYTFNDLVEIVKILRSPGGCPWDMEQNHKSIREDFLEETYEVLEAIDTENKVLLEEELGDVLLQVVFHSQISKEDNDFDINNVTDGICKKLIIRHPHVFSDVTVNSTEEVLSNWDDIKRQTKSQETQSVAMAAIPKTFPALMKAQKVQEKAKKAGFDWNDAEGAFQKVAEETSELKEALARLKFKALNITGANVATEVIVPGDEEAGIEDITASVARIAPELDADAVKAILGATASSANVTTDLITVSNDVNYTVDTDLEGLTGTNATVTFYTLVGGVKVPVATVKIVVEADVNGDGAIDVLDGALTELVSNERASLEGCYFIAANLDAASEEIVGADYTAVVNKILA